MDLSELKNCLSPTFDTNRIAEWIDTFVSTRSPEFKIFKPILNVCRSKESDEKRMKKMIAFSVQNNYDSNKTLKQLRDSNIFEVIGLTEYSVYTFKIIADHFWPSEIPKSYMKPDLLINYLKLSKIPNVIKKYADSELNYDIPPIDLQTRTENIKSMIDKFSGYEGKNVCYNGEYQEFDCDKDQTVNMFYTVKIGKKIGSGSTGNAYLACNLKTGTKICENTKHLSVIKFYDNIVYSKKQTKVILKAIEVFKMFSDLVLNHQSPHFLLHIYTFNCPNNLPIQIMERSKTDLYNIFKKNKENEDFRLSKSVAMFQILQAIKIMHTNNYAHCDLKLENIFCTPITNGEIIYKINDTDFVKLKTNYLVQISDFDFVNEIDRRKSVDKSSSFYNPTDYFRYKKALSKSADALYARYNIKEQLRESNNLELVDYLSIILFIGFTDLDVFDIDFIKKYCKNIDNTEMIHEYITDLCLENNEIKFIKNYKGTDYYDYGRNAARSQQS